MIHKLLQSFLFRPKNDPEESHAQSNINTGQWARKWHTGDNISEPVAWKREFTPKQYYEYMRQEIEREDGITNQRLTWAMSIQGFLIASMSLLLSGAWPIPFPTNPDTLVTNNLLRMFIFRELALLGIGVVGFCSAVNTSLGVTASRDAIDKVKGDWHVYNNILKIVPEMAVQSFGQGRTPRYGSLYAKAIPMLFATAWLLYLFAYILVVAPSLVWSFQTLFLK